MILFEDEKEAAQRLYDQLPIAKLKDYLIITPSLKSIVFVNELACRLDISYNFLFTEQIKAPNNSEWTIIIHYH